MKQNWPSRATQPRTFAAGLATGAALLYWFDPAGGARRRAELRQKALHASKEAVAAAELSARDIAHRSRGLLAKSRARWAETRLRRLGVAYDDEVVAERVRAKLGHLCSHPGSIEVSCVNGRVLLKGPILQDELAGVVRGVSRVRGVRGVESHLVPHLTADSIPGLQGGTRRRIRRPELLQEHWSPTARVLVGAAGTGLVFVGASRRGFEGLGARLLGAGLLARSLSNLPFRRILGVGAGRRAIDLKKDLHLNAPVEEVFAFFRRFENFPKIMSHILEVVDLGHGRWRWSVAGPAGVPTRWEAELTQYIPNELIAWRSIEGTAVGNAGIIRFEPDRGGTRIDLRLSYNPPAGAIGHAFASLFGSNPQRLLDEDLMQFKSFIEASRPTGERPGDSNANHSLNDRGRNEVRRHHEDKRG